MNGYIRNVVGVGIAARRVGSQWLLPFGLSDGDCFVYEMCSGVTPTQILNER